MRYNLFLFTPTNRITARTILFIAISLFTSFNVTKGQTSLQNSHNSKSPEEKTNAANALLLLKESLDIKKEDWQNSLKLSKEALKISKEEGFDSISIEALYNIGVLTYYNIDRDTAIHIYEEGYKYALRLNSNQKIYNYAIKIAEWHLYRSKDYKKSEQYFLEAIEIGLKEESYYDVGRAYARLAIIYVTKNDIKKVKELLEKSTYYYLLIDENHAAAYYNCDIGTRLWKYDLNNAVDFYLKGLALDNTHYFVNLSIGKAYITLGLPETAIPHLNLALDSLEVDEWRYGIGVNELADANLQLSNYDKADSLCNFNIKTYTTDGSRTQNCLSKSFLIKGKIQDLKNNSEKALELYNTSYKKANNSLDKTYALLELGEYYLRKDITKLSNQNCKNAYISAKSNNRKKLQSRACDCLYRTAKTRNNSDEALPYLEEKDQIERSLNESTAGQKLEVFAKLTLREKEVAYQEKIKDEQLKSQSNINKMLQLALLTGAIFILILFRMLNRIKRQNNEINSQSNILRKTNDNLLQSNEELERFAYIISHDLKTPLLAIVQFTKLLSQKLDDSAKPIIRECIEHIENGGNRMMRLIEDVLEFSKNSESDMNEDEVHLGTLLDDISELVSANPNQASIEYNAHTLPTIKWNHTKLLLLFKNIIENGLKYNNSENATIKISSETTASEINIHIEDNGIGIKEEYFNKIFVMFNRLHNHKTYSGTGLGLATCKKIVNEFKGEISIQSEIDKGSTFTIRIPINMLIT